MLMYHGHVYQCKSIFLVYRHSKLCSTFYAHWAAMEIQHSFGHCTAVGNSRSAFAGIDSQVDKL